MKIPKSVTVEIGVPGWGSIEGTWEPDENEQMAAWELYVELVTRISVADVSKSDYLLRESLESLHTLFDITRSILRKYGPAIAKPNNDRVLSLGYLAITILNSILRPFLSKWHPLLQDYESQKPTIISSLQHERNWQHYHEFRKELKQIQSSIYEYGNVLAEVSGVAPLVYRPE